MACELEVVVTHLAWSRASSRLNIRSSNRGSSDPVRQTYSYRVIAATDAGGRCQALDRSAAASATATGSCNFNPTFAGATSATSIEGPLAASR